MLVGVAIMLPIIIGYTAYAYWVFRGRVGHDGYHLGAGMSAAAKRWAWFVGIWAASVIALWLVARLLQPWIGP
jgi:hypothetical protein